jgi:hypothetical protein
MHKAMLPNLRQYNNPAVPPKVNSKRSFPFACNTSPSTCSSGLSATGFQLKRTNDGQLIQ